MDSPMALQLEEEENFGCAMQLVFSSVLSMSMQSAIELGVFDIIAKAGPGANLSSSEIAAHIDSGTRNSEAPMMLDRILRLLASHSILSCSVVANEEDGSDSQRLYSLGPVSNYFVTNEDGVSLGPMIALAQDKVVLDSWSQLKDAVVEGGIPFHRVHGKQSHEFTGVEHVGGDMLASVPSGDAILLKAILHNWSDQHCLKVLENCYNAIPDDGKVIIVEALLPVMPETSTAGKTTSLFDVLMMTQNKGGKERSREEFMTLATGAGFSGIKYECLVCNVWVMEIFK
ncbi:caffeic acid 3-O-methyltransferase 1-like isoform X3 [Malus sylvestris]|uniref:caffeic acid 3-O-methyltransferase 1-like isoform X3 n=1 Tax=Malus sylvestris TaxID=3752 RepID=UPI0021AC6CE4|nr:caffeic acid 3-O-methyltransferase 1-like isoform X3 [Malus sylvestris]